MIKIGNTGIVGVYKGSTPITSIYNGLDKVFGSTPSEGYIEFTATRPSSSYINFVLPIDFLGDTRTNMLKTNDIPNDEKFITGTVDWGDGTVEDVTINSSQIAKHKYTANNTYTIRFTPTNSPNVPVINFTDYPDKTMNSYLTHIKSTIPICLYINGGYGAPSDLTIEPGTPIVFGEYNGKQYGLYLYAAKLTADSLLSNLLGDDTVTNKLNKNSIIITGGSVTGNFLKGCKTTKISCHSTVSVLDYREYLGPVNPSMPLDQAPSNDNYIQIYLGDKITDIRYIFNGHSSYEFKPVIMDLGQHIPAKGYIDLSGITRWGYSGYSESHSVIPTAENARNLKAEGLSMDVWVDYDGRYEWQYSTESKFMDKGYTLVNK